MKYALLSLIQVLLWQISIAQNSVIEEATILSTTTGVIHGTLLLPEHSEKAPIALIIAGSGPTDRDGNNPRMKNNSLRMIAEDLAQNGIASLRYDKRGIAASREAGIEEVELRFEDYINDAISWIDFLRKDDRLGPLTVIGHSEGSLIGMVAVEKAEADKFISVAGMGEKMGNILKRQLQEQPPQILEWAIPIIDKLENAETVDTVSPFLFALFRPSVQPYLISAMKYDPQIEIAKLKCPVLILQGTHDIQITVEDAERLGSVLPHSETVIIEEMNHILKIAEANRIRNMLTYNNPELPVVPEALKSIVKFIKSK